MHIGLFWDKTWFKTSEDFFKHPGACKLLWQAIVVVPIQGCRLCPLPRTHCPNLVINLDGGLAQSKLWNCTAAALKLQKKTLAWSESDDVTQGLDAKHDFTYCNCSCEIWKSNEPGKLLWERKADNKYSRGEKEEKETKTVISSYDLAYWQLERQNINT